MLGRALAYDGCLRSGFKESGSGTTRHLRALQHEESVASFRVVAVIPKGEHDGWGRLLETVLMVFLNTVHPQTYFSRWKPEDADKCFRLLVKELGLSSRPWTGLNMVWSIAQGLGRNDTFTPTCQNCHPKGEKRYRADDGMLWHQRPCLNCHRWWQKYGEERPERDGR